MIHDLLFQLMLLAADPQTAESTDTPKAYTCPRCRRIEPKGPFKKPDPRYVPGAKKKS
ncbi:MAG: hypothetical protein JSR37_01555 [Verrucomicrobia bacterium]|nr:hypothetical protein [Verrucomicrobiota bacterium]MBS0637919.1 hypothetical protein [Verrucomicrobiota bacterium]